MTEQEKREKSIEEMARSICGNFNTKYCYDCHADCHAEEDAKALYDASYRKEEEVIKMTSKYLIQDFLRSCNMNGMTVEIIKKNLITMAKVIGVEVEV